MNSEKQGRSEWLQELTRLKVQFNNNQRKRFQLSTKSDLKEIYAELLNYEEALNKKTEKDKNALYSTINTIKKEISDIQLSLQTKDIDVLHNKLNNADNQLKELKIRSCEEYDKLSVEESALSKELKDYIEHLSLPKEEAKSKRPTTKQSQKVDEGVLDEESRFKKDIEAINSKIDSIGGTECGWEPADHKEFLKMAVRHKQRIKTLNFISDLQKLLPTLSDNEIKVHSDTYDQYLKLVNDRKQLMAEYKEYKSKKKQEIIENENTNLPPKPVTAHKVETEEEKRVKKEKIEQWKKEKEEQTTKIKESQALVSAKRRNKEQEAKRKSQMQKQIIEQYKEKKQKAQQITEIIEKEKAKASKKELTIEDKIRLRERERTKMEEKVRILKEKEEENMKKEMKAMMMMNKTKEKFGEVKPKLNEETTSLNQKKRTKFDASKEKGRDALTFGGSVMHQQMRAVPSWRAGI